MVLTSGIIFGLLAMIGWGLSDFFSKMAVQRVGGYKTLFYSYLSGSVVAIIFFIIFPQFSKITIFLAVLFLIEAFLNFLGYVFFYKGIEFEKISIISPIVAGYPVVIVLLSYFILNEILTLYQIIAFILMIFGLVLISIQKKITINYKRGVYLAIAAMLIWGVSIFLFGYLIKATHWLFALALSRILSSIFISSFFKLKKLSFSISKSIIPILILIGVVEIVGTIFYSIGVSVSSISLVSVISSLYPAMVIILARIFFKEKLNIHQKFGIIGMLLGLVLISL